MMSVAPHGAKTPYLDGTDQQRFSVRPASVRDQPARYTDQRSTCCIEHRISTIRFVGVSDAQNRDSRLKLLIAMIPTAPRFGYLADTQTLDPFG